MKDNVSYISLFSGCGGLDLGFIRNGFKCVAAFDKNNLVIENYNNNIGKHGFQIDLKNENVSNFFNDKIDIILSGSPCQGFSTAGKREFDDPRNSLMITTAEIALKIKPSLIVIENVPGVLSGKHKIYIDIITDLFKSNGYYVDIIKLNSIDYGVSQKRNRIFLFAWNSKKYIDIEIQKNNKKLSLDDAIRNIEFTQNHKPTFLDPRSLNGKIASNIKPGQKLCNVRGGSRSVHTWQLPDIFGHCTKKEIEILESLRILRRKIRTRSYGDADPVSLDDLQGYINCSVTKELGNLIRNGYVKMKDGKYDLTQTFNGLFRRLLKEEPSFTVDTRFGSPRYFLHPDENRGFTVREAARIQGFPDSYKFHGSESEQYKMIGNAVPPPLADRIASFILKSSLI